MPLSDVYAMGGVPKTAMNLVAYPMQKMGPDVLRAVLAGGIEKLREAKTVLIGGHSIEDDELKYGLSLTGFVHPQKIWTNQGLQPGDVLLLTKPLGTGIIGTAIKGKLATPETIARVTATMATLNNTAAEVLRSFTVTACTDVTGFGLLGHLAEMVVGSRVGVRIESQAVPILPEALEFAAMGFVPGGAARNRKFRQAMIQMTDNVSPVLRDVLFDPPNIRRIAGRLRATSGPRTEKPPDCGRGRRHRHHRHGACRPNRKDRHCLKKRSSVKMTVSLDARGLACPAPVLMAKNAIEKDNPDAVAVLVDNEAAGENVTRFFRTRHFTATTAKQGDDYLIEAEREGNAPQTKPVHRVSIERVADQTPKIMVMAASDRLGFGDAELGRKLAISFIKTIREMGAELWRLVLVNNAVKLAIAGSPVLEDLLEYERDGLTILVCGTCLTHFNLLEAKKVGQTTNMLDIVTAMQLADKVISL